MHTENPSTAQAQCIERAGREDAREIHALYHALIDDPFGSWSEEYPNLAQVEEDLAHQQVFVLRAADGHILSAIVSEKSDEFDGLAPWYADVTSWAQLARLGVAREAQGHGVAQRMLSYAMAQAKAEGCEAVRFLVAAQNVPAQRSYAHLGFEICGEADAWEGHWLCYQKRL